MVSKKYNGSNDWTEWRKHVLLELERLHAGQEKVEETMNSLRVDIGMLKVKSGMWGAAAGLLTALATVFLSML